MKSARGEPSFLWARVSTARAPSSSVTTCATKRARLTGPSIRTPTTSRGPISRSAAMSAFQRNVVSM